jgi:cyclophilin family peptidyl-prolyl cis-trans isomerase
MKNSSPRGVERFVELVESGFFQEVPLFRCVSDFLCQFGYKEDQEGDKHWKAIADDPQGPDTPKRFKRGYISFAGNGKNSRDSHLFVTLGEDVSSLGRELWETPIGYVTADSMRQVVSHWTTRYGDMPPWGKGPDPGKISRRGGSAYLKQSFPDLDYITSCKFVQPAPEAADTSKKPKIAFDMAPQLGRVVIELNPELSPLGVERLLKMLEVKFLDEARFFRVVPGFVVQFGMPADPKRGKEFPQIKDDPVKGSNKRGTVTFATSGRNTRTTQLFINLGDNARLDSMGFSPIGVVVEGMEFVDKINSEYGERPDQGQITQNGNEYLQKSFPRLSYISRAYIISEDISSVATHKVEDITVATHKVEGNTAIIQPHDGAMLAGGREGLLELMFAGAMVLLLISAFFVTIRVLFSQSSKAKKLDTI